MATMLQLIQQATGEMGLSVPSSVAGNTTADTVQQLALLNAVGYEVQRIFEWQAMTKVNYFNTAYLSTTGTVTDGSAVVTGIPDTSTLSTLYQVTGNGINTNVFIQSVDSGTQVTLTQECTASATGETLTFSKTKYAMPSDYDRQIDNTHWDKTQHWQMLGPETAQQWEWLVSGYISTGPRVRYRIFGSYFQIWPPQGVTHLLGFEYISNTWALSTLGVPKTAFTVDTDTCIFPDRLMVLGLKHKYFQVKGFGDVYKDDYEAEMSIAKANDAGSPTLSMAPRPSNILIGWENIPDSGYGA
jgi:hypothetical protein